MAVLWKLLAGAGMLMGEAGRATSSVELGEQLCEVFETSAGLLPRSSLELEHLALLAKGLEKEDVIALSNCANCGGVVIADLLGPRRRFCSHCQKEAPPADLLAGTTGNPAVNCDSSPKESEWGIQQELF